mgnify:FL=1|tara:strand:- start:21 stop:632 length:612 start_codon:yes stop_codon:yes gene_type:complete
MNIKLIKSTAIDSNLLLKLKNKYQLEYKLQKHKDNEHNKWFSKNLKNKRHKIYIIIVKEIKVGFVRSEIKKNNCYISIALIKKYEGKGIAKNALLKFEKIIKAKNYVAIVNKLNTKSLSFFLNCNYSIYTQKKENYIMKKNILKKNNYLKIIDDIENVRKKNNSNWMDILRIAFKFSPKETAKVMSKIYFQDSKISKLSKKLK